MALQGDIESFPVPDILRLLHGQDQTGRLRVEGDRGTLSIFMESGRLIAAEQNGETGVPVLDAMVELIRSSSGSFAFDADVKPIVATDPVMLESVLSEAEFCVAEWEEVEADVPSLEVWIRPVDILAADTITINSEQWRLLVAMGPGAVLSSLRSVSDLRPLELAREAKALSDLGAIELSSEPPESAPDNNTADTQGGFPSRFSAAGKNGGTGTGTGNGNGKGNGNGNGNRDSDTAAPVEARGALTSLASSLDRRLTDLGPPPGMRDRRVLAGSILDARDIGSAESRGTEGSTSSTDNADSSRDDG